MRRFYSMLFFVSIFSVAAQGVPQKMLTVSVSLGHSIRPSLHGEGGISGSIFLDRVETGINLCVQPVLGGPMQVFKKDYIVDKEKFKGELAGDAKVKVSLHLSAFRGSDMTGVAYDALSLTLCADPQPTSGYENCNTSEIRPQTFALTPWTYLHGKQLTLQGKFDGRAIYHNFHADVLLLPDTKSECK